MFLTTHSHAHFKQLELSSSSLGCNTLETAFDVHSTAHKLTVASKFVSAQVKEVIHKLIVYYILRVVPRKPSATMKTEYFRGLL